MTTRLGGKGGGQRSWRSLGPLAWYKPARSYSTLTQRILVLRSTPLQTDAAPQSSAPQWAKPAHGSSPLFLDLHDFLDEALALVHHDGRVNSREERLSLQLHHKDLHAAGVDGGRGDWIRYG
eukprot:362159-Chlamydomonas_euryale.AAC.4